MDLLTTHLTKFLVQCTANNYRNYHWLIMVNDADNSLSSFSQTTQMTRILDEA